VYTTSAVHCATGDCESYNVPRFTSTDLTQQGELAGDAMPTRPAWTDPDDAAIWAPQVAHIGNRYVMYFAATSGQRGTRGLKCLGAAVSATPEGPFVPLDDPLKCTPRFWNIDPYPVRDGDDWYLLWRQDDRAHATGKIVAAPLDNDGLTLADETPKTLLVGDYTWEEGHHDDAGIGPIENPAMARHPVTGDWLLTWSANRWETQDYATGLAICEGPTGPCERVSREAPWVSTSTDPAVDTEAEFGGAGGLSFVEGPDHQLYGVFHAYSGQGEAPDASRVGWAFRVEVGVSPNQYLLVDI
jgi:GH43 family beta-xylosidase